MRGAPLTKGQVTWLSRFNCADNPKKIRCFQAGAAHKRAIHFRQVKDIGGIVRFHRPAIQDAQSLGVVLGLGILLGAMKAVGKDAAVARYRQTLAKLAEGWTGGDA